eukprot:6491034-Amphidinium_carterae.4
MASKSSRSFAQPRTSMDTSPTTPREPSSHQCTCHPRPPCPFPTSYIGRSPISMQKAIGKPLIPNACAPKGISFPSALRQAA